MPENLKNRYKRTIFFEKKNRTAEEKLKALLDSKASELISSE